MLPVKPLEDLTGTPLRLPMPSLSATPGPAAPPGLAASQE